MIYHLLQNPSKLQILTKEIRSSFKTEEEIKGPAINNLKYLNAVINESETQPPRTRNDQENHKSWREHDLR
jgi:hypothetical protein